MSRNKKILMISAAAVLTAALLAAFCIHRYRYRDFVYKRLEDGTLELSKYWGDDPVVDIPEKVWGRKVTALGINCFSNNGLENYRVDIPETVVRIGGGAFEGCVNLTVTGGENVEEIRSAAFKNCSFAEDFTFSEKLSCIGDGAFSGARNIGRVELGDSLEYIGDFAFCVSDVDGLYIPESVQFIGRNAFRGTTWLKEQEGYVTAGDDILISFPVEETVMIPEGVRMISLSNGNLRNETITGIYIPDTVKVIENPMISVTNVEMTIYIPESVETIEPCSSGHDNYMVYTGMDLVTLVVEEGSYGEEYAKQMAEQCGTKYEVVEKIEYPE